MKIGYACINNALKEEGITTNRGMIKKTFLSKGIKYASELAVQNVRDLYTVMEWNVENGIKAFRMTSCLFPWMSEYTLTDLRDWPEITEILKDIGQIAISNDMRLSFHPGQFNILCSPKQQVIENTIKELNQHAFILDTMGLPCNQTHKVNIHIGGAYGDKNAAMDRWIENFKRLSDSAKKRLTIENDDKPNMYAVEDLVYVHLRTGVPIVFDFHHHDCHPGQLCKEDALKAALATWPDGITPMTHFSSSRKLHEDASVKNVAHADYLYDEIPYTCNHEFDVMLEAKAKEAALNKYIKDYLNEIVI